MPPGRPIVLKLEEAPPGLPYVGPLLRSRKLMTAISEAERARRQSESEQRRTARGSLRAEVQALHVELTERWHAELTAIREALAESIDEVIDQVLMQNKRLQTELWNLVKTQLGDLRARVDGVTKSAFRVASERADEVSELPDPLPPRRTIN